MVTRGKMTLEAMKQSFPRDTIAQMNAKSSVPKIVQFAFPTCWTKFFQQDLAKTHELTFCATWMPYFGETSCEFENAAHWDLQCFGMVPWTAEPIVGRFLLKRRTQHTSCWLTFFLCRRTVPIPSTVMPAQFESPCFKPQHNLNKAPKAFSVSAMQKGPVQFEQLQFRRNQLKKKQSECVGDLFFVCKRGKRRSGDGTPLSSIRFSWGSLNCSTK